jgi:hypothetical protein
MTELSRHALERAEARGFTEAQVLAAVEDPDLTYPSNPREHPTGREHRQRGRVVAVYEPATDTVISVLVHGQGWEEELT